MCLTSNGNAENNPTSFLSTGNKLNSSDSARWVDGAAWSTSWVDIYYNGNLIYPYLSAHSVGTAYLALTQTNNHILFFIISPLQTISLLVSMAVVCYSGCCMISLIVDRVEMSCRIIKGGSFIIYHEQNMIDEHYHQIPICRVGRIYPCTLIFTSAGGRSSG